MRLTLLLTVVPLLVTMVTLMGQRFKPDGARMRKFHINAVEQVGLASPPWLTSFHLSCEAPYDTLRSCSRVQALLLNICWFHLIRALPQINSPEATHLYTRASNHLS